MVADATDEAELTMIGRLAAGLPCDLRMSYMLVGVTTHSPQPTDEQPPHLACTREDERRREKTLIGNPLFHECCW